MAMGKYNGTGMRTYYAGPRGLRTRSELDHAG